VVIYGNTLFLKGIFQVIVNGIDISEKLIDVFEKIANTTKKTLKEQLLINNTSPELWECLRLCYDPFLNFNIRSEGIVAPIGNDETIPTEKLAWLAKVDDGRNAKKELIRQILAGKTAKTQKYIKAILDRDMGIGINTKTINRAYGLVSGKKLVEKFPIMLAERENKEKYILHYSGVPWVYVNLKYDGIRCVCDCIRGIQNIHFVSREGLPLSEFLVECIKEEMQAHWKQYENRVWDGEIFSNNFQNLMKVFRRSNIENDSIILRNGCKFVIFDVINDLPLEDRVSIIEGLQKTTKVSTVVYVKVKNDFGLLKEIAKMFIDKGHEGIIVKHPLAKYEDKRAFTWMKFKKSDSIDLEIINIKKGEGKYSEVMGNIVLDYDGKELSCGTGFTDEDRKYFWEHRKSLIGKTAQIKFMEKTKTDSLRHPVFECIRIDK
jgi:DNA ligase-1